VLLTYLRSLLTVAAEGSINRASRRLGLSQPTLTRQMQALEQMVGGSLFERGPSGVKLTDAGHALARHAPAIIRAADEALADTRRHARGQHDELRIGYIMSAAQAFVSPALKELRGAYPAMKVRLSELTPAEQIDGLRRGDLDLALVGHEGRGLEQEFYARRLATFPAMAALPASHPLASRSVIGLEELSNEIFIAVREDQMPGRNGWIAALCRKAGFKPRFGPEGTSITHVYSLITNEPGVTLVPGFLRLFPHPGIGLVGLKDEQATWDLLVVWHRGKHSEALKFLLESLQSAARSGGAKAAAGPRPGRSV